MQEVVVVSSPTGGWHTLYETNPHEFASEKACYSLNSVINHLHLDLEYLKCKREWKEPKVVNDHLAGKILEHILCITRIGL